MDKKMIERINELARKKKTQGLTQEETEEQNQLYGPGHNSFTVDEEGRDLLVFHARPYPGFKGDALSDPNRHCFLRTVEYTADGIPVFTR